MLVSTPTIKGDSRIEDAWLESTMEEWTVPCPECGEYQPMVWANVVFDREHWPRGGVQYRCESCGCIAGEYRWKAQGKKGRYAALHPEREIRGFHLNVLASSFCAWSNIVTEFLSAKEALDHGNPELMKVWVNTKLGETWEERGETADDMALLSRREMYPATVPAQVLVLTCGIDVQDDRFELELVGWGVGKESWGIRYQKIYGDPLKPQIWEDLDRFLQTRWRREDGVVLDILAADIIRTLCIVSALTGFIVMFTPSRDAAAQKHRSSRSRAPATVLVFRCTPLALTMARRWCTSD